MNNKGFTLIELLIIIVILSVLIAIIIPGYQKFKEEQKTISNTVESTSNETILKESLNFIKTDVKEALNEIKQIAKEKREDKGKVDQIIKEGENITRIESTKDTESKETKTLLKLADGIDDEMEKHNITKYKVPNCAVLNSLQTECIVGTSEKNYELICVKSYAGYDCKLKN